MNSLKNFFFFLAFLSTKDSLQMWRDGTIKQTVLFQTCRPGAWEPETPEEEMARIALQGNLCESFLLPSSSLSSDCEALRLETTDKTESKLHCPPSCHPGNTV